MSMMIPKPGQLWKCHTTVVLYGTHSLFGTHPGDVILILETIERTDVKSVDNYDCKVLYSERIWSVKSNSFFAGQLSLVEPQGK